MKIVAVGPDPTTQQRRLKIRAGRVVRLGRAPSIDDDDFLSRGHLTAVELWPVPWDRKISRNHADLWLEEDRLRVKRHPASANPVIFRGDRVQRFYLSTHEHFLIGDTTFHFLDDSAVVGGEDPEDYTFSDVVGSETPGLDDDQAKQKLDLLGGLAPILRRHGRSRAWVADTVTLLLQALPTAEAVAVVRVGHGEGVAPVEVVDWESRGGLHGDFRPSRRLILRAITQQRKTVQCRWNKEDDTSPEFTRYEPLDWAFCTPFTGTSRAGWGVYVAGRAGPISGALDLGSGVRFTELVADLLGAVGDLEDLQTVRDTLGRFFSPRMLPLLSSAAGQQALRPREAEVSVLFCDLVAFSRTAEDATDLPALFARVSWALDVIAEVVHAHRGVVGDFQGDAALAFWGWPVDEGDGAVLACRAAIEINRRFGAAEGVGDQKLRGLACTVGIAKGVAYAGRLGTSRQVKVDVFGPVVNLAARLQSMTRHLGVSILTDDTTLEAVRRTTEGSTLRFRRLARIRPYGLRQALMVSELVAEGDEELTSDQIERYEAALESFVAGEWEGALGMLEGMPDQDKGTELLKRYILEHERRAPRSWEGVIEMDRK